MKITKFEELIAWQKAQELAVDVYHYFGTSRDFAFRDQNHTGSCFYIK
jgi:hypothetical protein